MNEKINIFVINVCTFIKCEANIRFSWKAWKYYALNNRVEALAWKEFESTFNVRNLIILKFTENCQKKHHKKHLKLIFISSTTTYCQSFL